MIDINSYLRQTNGVSELDRFESDGMTSLLLETTSFGKKKDSKKTCGYNIRDSFDYDLDNLSHLNISVRTPYFPNIYCCTLHLDYEYQLKGLMGSPITIGGLSINQPMTLMFPVFNFSGSSLKFSLKNRYIKASFSRIEK